MEAISFSAPAWSDHPGSGPASFSPVRPRPTTLPPECGEEHPPALAASDSMAKTPASSPFVALSEVWEGLLVGTLQVVGSWYSELEAGLILERRRSTRDPMNPRRAEVLRRVLCGESQKSVAISAGSSASAVAVQCAETWRSMGGQCRCSRIPIVLMLAAHAAAGAALPPARVHRLETRGSERLVLSVKRPEVGRPPALTPAEQAVFKMFMEGFSYVDIARTSRKSVRTVANQLAAVFRKFGEAGRAAIVGRLVCA